MDMQANDVEQGHHASAIPVDDKAPVGKENPVSLTGLTTSSRVEEYAWK
jgi:hypothetical protein